MTLAALAWLAAPGLSQAGVPEEDYALAATHYAEGRWALAADSFQDFVNSHSAHSQAEPAQFFLGESLMQLERYAAAGRAFETLVTRYPASPHLPQAKFRQGEAAYLGGDTAAARRKLKAFVREFPHHALHAHAQFYLGELCLAHPADAQRAEQHFAKALRKLDPSPLKHDCQLGRARALSLLGRDQEAEPLLRELVKLPANPLAGRAQFQLGLLLHQRGQNAQALEVWETCISQFPASEVRPLAELGRGWSLYKLRRLDEAKKCFSSLAQEETVGIEAQYWLGLTHRALKQWTEAARTLSAAVTAAPGHPLATAIRFHAGDSLLQLGNRAEAASHFEQVLATSPSSPWADNCQLGVIQAALQGQAYDEVERLVPLFRKQFASSSLLPEAELVLATARVAQKKYEAAIEPLLAYLSAAGPRASVQAELALCFARTGEFGKAKEVYAELLRQPGREAAFATVTHRLAEIALTAGERSWATELLRQLAAESAPEHAVKGVAGLAWAHLKAGELTEAAKRFDELLEKYPNSAVYAKAVLARGQICEKQGQDAEALACYQRLVNASVQDALRPQALLYAASVHDRLQHQADAVKLLAQLVEQHPDFGQLDLAIYNLAWAQTKAGLDAESIASFERLAQKFPNSRYWADATYRLAEHANGAQEFEKSSALLSQLVAAKPKSEILAHALYLQGRIAASQQQWEAVAAPMQRLLTECSESPLCLPARYSLAEACYWQEHYDEAGELLEALSRDVEGRDDLWMAMIPLRRAQVFAQQSKWPEALEAAQSIASAFPSFKKQHEADYVIGRCLASQGQFDAAREAYRQVIDSASGSKTETAAMAQWMIGESYFHQKDFQTAHREYQKTEVLYAYPHWQAAALLQVGKCHEHLQQWRYAVDAYAKLVRNHSETEYAAEAQSRLSIARQHLSRATAASGGSNTQRP